MHLGTTTPEVRSLHSKSPAELAGMKVGDVILAINDRRIDDYRQVIDACYMLTVGSPAKFRVLRDLDEVTLTVVPKKKEDNEALQQALRAHLAGSAGRAIRAALQTRREQFTVEYYDENKDGKVSVGRVSVLQP